MRVLEFFSGIGGWRCALDKLPQSLPLREDERDGDPPASTLSPYDVIESFDINTIANQVYQHNFQTKPNPKCLEPREYATKRLGRFR